MKVYKSDKAKIRIRETYDQLLELWDVEKEERDIATTYGTTHVIICGKTSYPPLVLFHGVGDDSALMWLYNAKELSGHFRIYAVDTIGGPGKSCPNEKYNKNFNEIHWLDEVVGGLKLDKFYAAGVSNGALITQYYGIMRPEKVIKLICMSGSALSADESENPLKRMLKVFLPEALFPTNKNIVKLIRKMAGKNSSAFTDNPVLMRHFTYILRGFNNMSMSYHKITRFNQQQILQIKDKTLFLCGESDPLGNVEKVKAIFEKYDLRYRYFPGVGHGINHEIANEVNKIIIEFFLDSDRNFA